MKLADYMKVLRRRWIDIVLAVHIAFVAGWVLTSVAPVEEAQKSYEATSVLVSTGDTFAPGITNLGALAALTTVGDVPERVAESIDYEGNPLELTEQVRASANLQTGILRITATSSGSGRAKVLANTFARQLVGFLEDQKARIVAQEGEPLSQRLDRLDGEIKELDKQITRGPPAETSVLQAQRDAKVRQYGLLYESYQQLAATASNPSGLQVIQAAYPVRVETGGFKPPASRVGRMIIAGILGLIAGVVLVLFLETFDTRIRTREDAERRFELPVLAEIPRAPRGKRKGLANAVFSDPRSRFADAFRVLGTMLTVWRPQREDGTALSPGARGENPPRTILVTSPGPADGKTTVVANLAASFSMRGCRVVILSCDFRRPRIDALLGVPNETGLAEALQSPNGAKLEAKPTSLAGVRLIPSGAPPERPAELLGSAKMRSIISDARLGSDVVLIDSAPILTTSDPADLAQEVDAVVLVARAGRTTPEVAERTGVLLKRLGAPVVGIVLNASTEITTPRNYYGYYQTTGVASKQRRGIHGLARHLGKH
jgi:capsular exopolysaccharide synthesis family protein